jgi:predicted PurR-regulated permease PerM
MYPAYLGILIIAVVITVPFYFFNKFLQRRIKPKESGSKLLLYFAIVVLSIFIYITACIYLAVWVAKMINKA